MPAILPKKKSKNDHGPEGLNYRPRDPENRLFVANLDVTPSEEIENLPRPPDFRKPLTHVVSA